MKDFFYLWIVEVGAMVWKMIKAFTCAYQSFTLYTCNHLFFIFILGNLWLTHNRKSGSSSLTWMHSSNLKNLSSFRYLLFSFLFQATQRFMIGNSKGHYFCIIILFSRQSISVNIVICRHLTIVVSS